MSSPDPVLKTNQEINQRQSQSQSQQQQQSTSSSPNAILVEEIFEDPAVVSPSSAKDSPPKNPQSDDIDSATRNNNNNCNNIDVGDQPRSLAEQGRVSSVVGKIVPTIQDDDDEQKVDENDDEDDDETPLEVQCNISSTNSNNNSTIIPKLNLSDKQQQQQQENLQEDDDDDLNSSDAPTGRSIDLSSRNNNNENNATSSSSAPLSSRLSLPPTGPSAANINNQNNNTSNSNTLQAPPPHHHHHFQHNRTGSALSSGRTSPRVQGISVTFKLESHHQNQNATHNTNHEDAPHSSSSSSPTIAPSSNNNNNSSKNNNHHQDTSSSSASNAHLSEAEREVQIRNEQLEILSIGVRAKYPRCAERNQSDRTMTDALIQQYRKLVTNSNGSDTTASTSLISQAVDDFLIPVTTTTSKVTVSGVAWTVSNLLGASNAAASAIHQQGHTNKHKLEPIIYNTGAGIINVRGTMLVGTTLNHSQSSAAASNNSNNNNNDAKNSNDHGTNQYASFVDFDPAALQSVTALQTSMQMWTAPQFFVDLTNDGPFSFSRFDDPNQGMVPASSAELVAGASRFRGRTPLPSSSSSSLSPSQSAKKIIATNKSANVASSTSTTKENETTTTTTTSVRFSLYHLKKDLVIQFRCQSSHDMIHLKKAISVALGIAQNQKNNHGDISTSSEKKFTQISLRIEHDEYSLEKFSKNKNFVHVKNSLLRQLDGTGSDECFYFLNKNRFSNPLGHAPSMSLFGGYSKVQATETIGTHHKKEQSDRDEEDGDEEKKMMVTHQCKTLVWTKNKTSASAIEKEASNAISRSLSRIPGFPIICAASTTDNSEGEQQEETLEDIECFTVPATNFLSESSSKVADDANNTGEQIKKNHTTEHFSLWELAKLVQSEQQQRVHPAEHDGEENNNNNSPISGFLSAAATKYVIAQLALTISLAHRRGVVVGPLTPSRILYFFQIPENINLVVEMMEKQQPQNSAENSPSRNSPSSASSSPTKQLVMNTPPSHNSIDNRNNNNTAGVKSILSILPPLFATLIGSGEAPCPRVWNLLRTSPSLLPFLPTWFLREGLLKLAAATKREDEELIEKKLLEESSAAPATTSHKRNNIPEKNSRHDFNTSSTSAASRSNAHQALPVVEADRWTQGDDWASLGCLMFWLRTGRPVHAEKENFLNGNVIKTPSSSIPLPSSLSSSPQIHQFAASNISSKQPNNGNSTSTISPLNQYVNTLIESLEAADRVTASNWHSVLSQFAIAPTLSEWNWRVLKNINASSSSSARHNHNQTTNKPPSSPPQHHNQHSPHQASDGDMAITSLISPVERNLLLRLLQLPEAQGSASNTNLNAHNHNNSYGHATINGIPVIFDARGGEGNMSSSRSSSRNTTPRGGTATTCRNTEPPSATDILLHPYFAHVNWLDVFNQDANSGVVTN